MIAVCEDKTWALGTNPYPNVVGTEQRRGKYEEGNMVDERVPTRGFSLKKSQTPLGWWMR